jgi:hypothetical protein
MNSHFEGCLTLRVFCLRQFRNDVGEKSFECKFSTCAWLERRINIDGYMRLSLMNSVFKTARIKKTQIR